MRSEKTVPLASRWLVVGEIFRNKSILSKVDLKLLSLLFLPLFLIILNDDWIFSWMFRVPIDDRVYFGYFLDLKQHLNTFGGTYYGTRLPWILPGFLAYQFFSPITAAYVLHLLFYFVAVSSLYLILKYTIGRRAAILTAILLGCHCFFLESIGHNYIDGAGLTYLLLTLLMLINGAKHQFFYSRLFLAGIFYGCTIYTQLFLITYAPLIVLFYLFFNREHWQHCIANSLKLFIFGFLGLTLFLCCVNYLLNGTFFFYDPIIQWTTDFVKGANPWWSSFSTWYTSAIWLVVPAITFFGSVFFLIFYSVIRASLNKRFYLFFQIYFVLNVLLHIVFQMAFRQPVLNFSYYSSYLLPGMFLAMGSQLAIVVNILSRRQFYLILSVIIASSFFVLAFPIDLKLIEKWKFYLMLSSILFGIVGLGSVISQSRYLRKIGVFLFFISMLFVNMSGINKLKPPIYDSAFPKNSFLAVVDSVKAIQSMEPKGVSRFWYNYHQSYGSMFRDIASAYLWRYLDENFPKLNNPNLSYQLVPRDCLFILSDSENVLEEANKALIPLGFKGEFLDEKTIQRGKVKFKITYIRVCSLIEVL